MAATNNSQFSLIRLHQKVVKNTQNNLTEPQTNSPYQNKIFNLQSYMIETSSRMCHNIPL